MIEDMTGEGLISVPAVGPDDLRWWLELAPSLEWTWAKTYADSAPHDYVVLGRTPGLTRLDMVRAGAVIRTFGQPGKFHSSTNIYLRDGGLKYWTMDARVKDTDLINRASVERSYGPQDAPVTATGSMEEYDRIAADYDLRRDDSQDRAVRSKIADDFQGRSPRALDVGCGTGPLLDMGVVSPSDFTGLDCSQGMLNELLLKHPTVHRVIPARFEDVSNEVLGGPFELVAAMDVPGVDLDRIRTLCCGLLVVTPAL